MDPNQDKKDDTGVATPVPTTGTDQPTVGDQTPPVVPADEPTDQPVVTPEPVVDQPAPKTSEVPTSEPTPTIPKPTTDEGEGTSGGTPPPTV